MVGYEFYTDNFGGASIPESAWMRLSIKAETKLKKYTFNRIKELDNVMKCAICDMAEYIFDYESRKGKTSENTDGYSVSYDTSESYESKMYEIASDYLLNTGLMDMEVEHDHKCICDTVF